MSSTAIPAPPLMRERSRARSGGDHPRSSNNNNTTHTIPSSSSSSAPAVPERRLSGLSFMGLDDRRHSVTSTANDFILPSVGDSRESIHDAPSHWHSTPLAFAILPAIGGLFFTDGSAFITDILLLGLAAIFLNWSVRLPWDWYHRAQSTVQLSPRSRSNSSADDDQEHDPKVATEAARRKLEGEDVAVQESSDHESAARQLRSHEVFALLSTFLFPAFAAYLLHVIRGQLSRPSTGLVSDYNLTIFLLAAEIRPFRHLIRLVTNRTVHLQRIVNPDNLASKLTSDRHDDFAIRVEQLEAKLAEQLSSAAFESPAQKEELSQLSNDVKKRYEPRIDALERALRRYEKRVTTLTILTEQRLQNLQSKLDDALSLAAVAAQSSQQQGLVTGVLHASAMALAVPLQAVVALVMAPIALANDVARKTTEVLFGPRASKSAKTKDKEAAEARASSKRSKMERMERMDKADRERRRVAKD